MDPKKKKKKKKTTPKFGRETRAMLSYTKKRINSHLHLKSIHGWNPKAHHKYALTVSFLGSWYIKSEHQPV